MGDDVAIAAGKGLTANVLSICLGCFRYSHLGTPFRYAGLPLVLDGVCEGAGTLSI